jgi:hypothetical protein
MRDASTSTAESRAAMGPLVITALFATVAIVWVAPRLAMGSYRELIIAAVLFQSVWIFLRWRASVYAFMVYVIVEGFLINFFDGVSELNLLKDVFVVLLFFVLAAMLIARGTFPFPKLPWVVPFAAFAVVYLGEVFNPHLPNILVGLVGVRTTLLYFLLVPVAYWFFDTRERVLRFFVFMAVVSVPVAAFGIVQYYMGPEWMAAMSPGFNRAIFYAFGLNPRPEDMYFRTFSTFVHTGAFAQYLVFLMLITLALWAIPRMRSYRPWIAALFVLLFLAQLTTGGRSSMVYFVVAVAFWFLMQRASVRFSPLLVLVPVLLVGTVSIFGEGFVERYASLLDLDYVKERNMPLLTGWLQESMKVEWVGLGAGYASTAARHVGVTPLNISVVENGLAKVRFEAGLPGFVLFVSFVFALGVHCVRQALHVRDPQMRWFTTACAAYILVNLLSVSMGTPFDGSPTNTYIWFFAGFLARAPRLVSAPVGQLPQE